MVRRGPVDGSSRQGFGFLPAYVLFFLPVLTANRCFNFHEGSTSGSRIEPAERLDRVLANGEEAIAA